MARKTVKAPGVFSKLKRKLTGKSGTGNAKKKGLPKSKKKGTASKAGSAVADSLMGKKKKVVAKKAKPRARKRTTGVKINRGGR